MTKRKIDLVRFSDLQPRRPDFLWRPYLVRGKVNNLQGPGGSMKTTMAVDWLARVTVGGFMPHSTEPLTPGNGLYFTVEDDPEDTILPRFLAAGGDPTRMWAASGTVHYDANGKPIRGALSLTHLREIDDAFAEYQPRVAVVDPATSFLGTDIDMHRANEVRPVVEGVGALAAKHGVTVILILHVAKSGGASAAYRALGTVDFGNIARSVLYVGEHEGKPVLTQAKMNLAEKGRSIYYESVASDFEVAGERVNRIKWGGYADITADELASQGTDRGPTSAFDVGEVEEFILSELSVPLTASTLEQHVKDGIGVTRNMFERARRNLRERGLIANKRHGFGPGSGVHWYRTDQHVHWSDPE